MTLYDLTIEMSTQTTVFPGDPKVQIDTLCDVAKGDNFTLKHFHFGNHTGTHIDFPAHIIEGGQQSQDYPIDYLRGNGKIIEIADDNHVCANHIKAADIKQGDIVFFKTSNTRKALHKGCFNPNFVAIEKEAAMALVAIGVKIVGIDYLSVDKFEDELLATHHALLSHNVLVVENVKLDQIPAGNYHINISPIRFSHADGLPVRITAEAITTTADTAGNEH